MCKNVFLKTRDSRAQFTFESGIFMIWERKLLAQTNVDSSPLYKIEEKNYSLTFNVHITSFTLQSRHLRMFLNESWKHFKFQKEEKKLCAYR